jgi:ketosteroid isomerase-like protein
MAASAGTPLAPRWHGKRYGCSFDVVPKKRATRGIAERNGTESVVVKVPRGGLSSRGGVHSPVAFSGAWAVISRTQEAEMRTLTVILSVTAALSVPSFVGSQTDLTTPPTDPTLNKLAADFAAAFNAKDAAKVTSFFANDAVVMPPNKPMVNGRTNIEAVFKRDFQEGVANLQLKPMESAIAGAHAFDAGTSSVTLPGGRTESGKYLTLYKRVGGDWKIAYTSSNSDQPPEPPK